MMSKTPKGERGDALILVIIATMLITLIPAGLVAASIGQLPQTKQRQENQVALAAAEAGIANYENLLDQYSINQLGNYWQYDASNPPPVANLALTGWEPVAGSSTEYFHYSVDNAQTASSGIVRLLVSGAAASGANTQYVTLNATFRSQSFLNYLVFSNKMVVDPVFAVHSAQIPNTKAEQYCNFSFAQSNGSSQQPTHGPVLPYCESLLNFYVTGQTFNGPVFSNDMFYLAGQPVFNGPVYSASAVTSGIPAHPYWIDPINAYLGGNNIDNPVFNVGGNVQYHTPLALPQSDATLEQTAATGGCLYYGPTQVTLNGTTMTVVSPQTKNATCVGANVPLPANGVLYVASLPGAQSQTCASGSLNIDQQYAPCQEGNLYIQGTLNDQLTAASQNNITITGNLEYAGCGANGTSSLLGLIANNFVQLSNNFAKTNTTPDSCFAHPANDPVIMAAILTLQHSFAVKDFWKLPYEGTIYLYGALAGNYSDIEGVFQGTQITNGYGTNYTYDTRLAYLSPPYFLTPVASSWTELSSVAVNNPSSLPALPGS
ncbi:MAG: hypothetical protein ACYCWN_09355 [Ferrimicrobium sp.]|jgi:hypothetical protein|uniref:Flp pilus-assembly TadE/G-like n=1 Tax=Ferrimicrobium acidiphilum TaxID=121039 RepID=A0ABV3Y0U3_9ACTN|nr:hypothetical protein [Ferrimicrobium sp.]